MRAGDAFAVITTVLLGGITGWLLGGTPGAAMGAVMFASLALVGVRANVRPAIVATVLVGTMTGWLIGASIVEAICLPATCSTLEIIGGLVAAVISFVGVGLVAALVTRSFDEYNERSAAGLPPTQIGCEEADTRQETKDESL